MQGQGGVNNSELFNLPGYSQSDIQGLGIEHVRSTEPFILRAREAYLIKKKRILIPTKMGLISNYSFASVGQTCLGFELGWTGLGLGLGGLGTKGLGTGLD